MIAYPWSAIPRLDDYPDYDIPIHDALQNVHPLYQLTEHRMLAIEVGLRGIGDEELAAVGVGTRIGH